MPSLRQRDEMPDNAKLFHAGILSNQTRSAEGLQTIISNFFQLPVKVEQFVGHWIKLPEDCLCRLGESPDSGSLGMNTVIGARVWDCQSRFRIVLGPLDIDQYQRLLPTGNSLQRLVSIVKNYIGMELSWDIRLILEKRQAPLLKLGKNAQLGWTTWLKNGSFDKDHQDLIFDPCIKRDIQ
jgi:type VI secretion system protein ImpH